MARNQTFIEIQGLYSSEVLGTFQCIRGYAPLQDLADISVPVMMESAGANGEVTGHQRQLDVTRAENLKRYFEDGDQRFIPEVVLSLRVPIEAENDGNRQIGAYHQTDDIHLFRNYASRHILNHVLKVRLESLPQIIAEKRIRRIDGNHRLAKAAELAPAAGQSNKYLAPFCLLLLGDVGDPAQDYSEALIFHTINSMAKPLDSDHALQLILGQNAGYTQPAHMEFAFSPALHLTRLLDSKLRSLPEPARSRLGGRSLARLSVASRELLANFPERASSIEELTTFRDEIAAALLDLCTHLHVEFPDFCAADYFIELSTYVWMRSSSGEAHQRRMAETVDYLRDMARWMGTDGMRGLTTDKTLGRQLIEIYDAVRCRVPKKVFLARWYPGQSDGQELVRANHRLNAIRQLVERELHLELVDLGSEEGGTLPIHQHMYEEIGGSQIFIADLTGLRPNVMIELGYALHHMHTRRLILIFNPIASAPRVPFDTSTFRYKRIDEAADISGQIRGDLEEILAAAREGRI